MIFVNIKATSFHVNMGMFFSLRMLFSLLNSSSIAKASALGDESITLATPISSTHLDAMLPLVMISFFLLAKTSFISNG